MKCDVCDNEMKEFKQGWTVGWKCTICGNNWLTTLMPEIDADINEYEIVLKTGNAASSANIKVVSGIGNCNFLEARKKLLNGEMIRRDNARAIQECALKLDTAKIKFEIEPEFPYSIKTGELIER